MDSLLIIIQVDLLMIPISYWFPVE